MIQCTHDEVAAIMQCSEDTLCRRVKDKFGMTFADYFKVVSPGGKTSLRRKQWKLADKNASMAIFLGKNMLGQSDKNELTHKQSEPFILAYNLDE